MTRASENQSSMSRPSTAAPRDLRIVRFGQQGPQDPRIIKPGYPNSPSRPRGRREEATDYRPQVRIAFRTQASSLAASSLPQKRTRSELTIIPIQLRSSGDHERCTPPKSMDDSENAVGIAPMAMPLDLAMEVWDPWPKAVELTGKSLALPVSEHPLATRVLVALARYRCSA
jgi:hypothetical protein